MNLKQIATIAEKRGIKLGKLKKADLIRTIQLDEGNFDCFGTALSGVCDQTACSWRDDCLGKKTA